MIRMLIKLAPFALILPVSIALLASVAREHIWIVTKSLVWPNATVSKIYSRANWMPDAFVLSALAQSVATPTGIHFAVTDVRGQKHTEEEWKQTRAAVL